MAKVGGVMVACAAACVMMMMVVAVRAECKIANPRPCGRDRTQSIVKSVEYNGTCTQTSPKKPIIVIGETYTIKLNFVPVKDAKHAKMRVWARFGPLLIPQDVGNPNACVKKGLKCPLSADKLYTYTNMIHVSSHIHFYQPEDLQLLWGLMDEKASLLEEHNVHMDMKHKIFCVYVPVVLKPSVKIVNATTTTTPRMPVSKPIFKVV